ncbi:MAG: acylneuraminate cytidylyltransferase family protein [Myxococcales bacterium]|nr:acylneuraminate cytidylyltransferase family protein [Myxococcales bacterium]
MSRWLAVIPARGGSRRLPRKNLALLGGKPLLAHSIEAARAARRLWRVAVSTDDALIADVARAYGAEVIMRPAELASDSAPTEPTLRHALEHVEQQLGEQISGVVTLQPTSPLRGANRIDQAITLLESAGADSVCAVVHNVDYYFLGDIDADGRLQVGYDPQRRLRTQDITPRYKDNGAIYVSRRALIVGDPCCRMGGDVRALVMEPWESIDIDEMVDLLEAAAVLELRNRSADAEIDAQLSFARGWAS